MSAEFVTVRTASLLLDGIAERVIRDAIAAGDLRASRFGRSIRIKHADLTAWADSKASPSP